MLSRIRAFRNLDKQFCCIICFFLFCNILLFSFFSTYFEDSYVGDIQSDHLRKSPYSFSRNKSLNRGNEYSETSGLNFEGTELPAFSYDTTEFVFGAVIESHGTGSSKLTLTVFTLNRHLLSQGRGIWGPNRVAKEAKYLWRLFEEKSYKISYSKNGTRDQNNNIYCQLSNEISGSSYLVPGIFIPSSLSLDSTFNSKFDIFRCEIMNCAPGEYLISSNLSLEVKLLRYKKPNTWSPLLNFSVPWKSRRVGYMHEPPGISSNSALLAMASNNPRFQSKIFSSIEGDLSFSNWNPWRWREDKSLHVYLCVRGIKSSPNLKSIADLLEFIEHHSQLGIEHIFIAVGYSWNSRNMHTFLLALRYHIEGGLVSVVSEAGDSIDRTSSTKGMAWGNNFLRLYFCTVTMYLLKGIHGSQPHVYLGIWNYDSFFIPQYPYTTVHGAILENEKRIAQSLSLIPLRTRHIVLRRMPGAEIMDRLWLGQLFSSDFHFFDEINKSLEGQFEGLWPVPHTQQFGLVKPRYFFEDEFIFQNSNQSNESFAKAVSRKKFDFAGQPCLYKFRYEPMDKKERMGYKASKLMFANRYSSNFSSRVYAKLKEVNLDLIISLSKLSTPEKVGTAVEFWPRYTSITQDSTL